MEFKLEHDAFFEPKAMSHYEVLMSNCGRPVSVEKSGFVVNTDKYIFGATPDGKVMGTSEENDILAYWKLNALRFKKLKHLQDKLLTFILQSSPNGINFNWDKLVCLCCLYIQSASY